MEDLYFQTKDKIYHPEFQVKNAFYLATGKKANDYPEEYTKWLRDIWGKAIISKHKASEIQITPELYKHQRLLCYKLYRETHKRSLYEAKEALDAEYREENVTS